MATVRFDPCEVCFCKIRRLFVREYSVWIERVRLEDSIIVKVNSEIIAWYLFLATPLENFSCEQRLHSMWYHLANIPWLNRLFKVWLVLVVVVDSRREWVNPNDCKGTAIFRRQKPSSRKKSQKLGTVNLVKWKRLRFTSGSWDGDDI